MPRPKRWRALVVTSFYFPVERQDTIDMLKELADRERISLSEMLVNAAAEYVENHYPGNPQMALESFKDDGLKPVRLEVKIISRKVEWWLGKLEDPRLDEQFKKRARASDLPPLLVKLSRLNLRLRDEEISELVERGEKECFGEGCA